MDEFLKKFGEKVRSYREVYGYSQEKLAEIADVSTNTVNSIENGKTFFTYQTLKNISTALNVTMTDLFDFTIKEDKVQDKLLEQIIAYARPLSPEQKTQVVGILKTFKI